MSAKTTWKMGERVRFKVPAENAGPLAGQTEAEGTLAMLLMRDGGGEESVREATISVPGFPYELLYTVPMEKVRDA